MAKITTQSRQAIQALRDGEPVGLPTETVYGLGANALLPEAVAEIFAVKRRPVFDPLIIHLARAKCISDYARSLPDDFYRLYDHFGAGPLTYILPKNERIPDIVTSGQNTVAVRFPQHPLMQEVLREVDFPVAAPSANLFGKVSPVTAEHVQEQLGESIELILDGGSSVVGLESTIIDLSGPRAEVLRLGGVALEELEEVLARKIHFRTHSSSKPRAPGMLTAHYSPGSPVLHEQRNVLESMPAPGSIQAITWKKPLASIPLDQQSVLSPEGSLSEAAAQLFTVLRELSRKNPSAIWAEHFPEEGLGRAINDRLRRAAVSSSD